MSVWDEGAVTTMTTLAAEKRSASFITRILAEHGYSFTRNAVIGKLHRLALNTGRAPARTKPRSAPRPQPSLAPVGHGVPAEIEPRPPRAPLRRTIEPRSFLTPAPRPAPRPALPVTQPTNEPVPLEHLTGFHETPGMCRWPVGGARETTLFCAAPKDAGKPYCPYHTAGAYGPGTRSERDAERQAAIAMKRSQ